MGFGGLLEFKNALTPKKFNFFSKSKNCDLVDYIKDMAKLRFQIGATVLIKKRFQIDPGI